MPGQGCRRGLQTRRHQADAPRALLPDRKGRGAPLPDPRQVPRPWPRADHLFAESLPELEVPRDPLPGRRAIFRRLPPSACEDARFFARRAGLRALPARVDGRVLSPRLRLRLRSGGRPGAARPQLRRGDDWPSCGRSAGTSPTHRFRAGLEPATPRSCSLPLDFPGEPELRFRPCAVAATSRVVVESLVLKGNGSLAWLVLRTGDTTGQVPPPPAVREVYAVDAEGWRRLDSGPALGEASLRLDAATSTLSWVNAGASRTAALD